MRAVRHASNASNAFFALIVFMTALVWLSPIAAAKCPAGWKLSQAGYCFSPGDFGNDAKPCMGECDHCAGMRGARDGEPGGVEAGCKECPPRSVCFQCVKLASCLDGPLGPLKKPSDVYTQTPGDPCPPKCKTKPDLFKRYQSQ